MLVNEMPIKTIVTYLEEDNFMDFDFNKNFDINLNFKIDYKYKNIEGINKTSYYLDLCDSLKNINKLDDSYWHITIGDPVNPLFKINNLSNYEICLHPHKVNDGSFISDENTIEYLFKNKNIKLLENLVSGIKCKLYSTFFL